MVAVSSPSFSVNAIYFFTATRSFNLCCTAAGFHQDAVLRAPNALLSDLTRNYIWHLPEVVSLVVQGEGSYLFRTCRVLAPESSPPGGNRQTSPEGG